jgi:phosphoenolpyruvate carboxykinase (GTP)
LLYRQGYEEFIRRASQGTPNKFYKFVHSQGEVDERKVSKNLDKRRVYIDLYDDMVYSTNTQYGGNSIGLKKLAMRLAIFQASQEGWLTEHMLILGIRGPENRITYFTGAYPSMCGKTSTAMIEGESMVGDDIAYLRKKDGIVRAVNVERGMFGIIQGINSKDDPLLWKALNNPGDIIFSNVLITDDGGVHWIDKDGDDPPKGKNHSGEWVKGKKDAKGKDIPPSHPNARFTLGLKLLDNVDPRLDDSEGLEVGGMVYGGRDSDTCVPVEEAFNWSHGIITKGAALESETTAATLGKEGVREINPMANLDFLSVPVGKYIQMNLDFEKGLKKTSLIFSVNYFLKDKDGKWLNEKNDKQVWFKWMELRVNNDADVIETPTGMIPKYDDLKRLFKEVLNKDYTEEDYIKQFTIRIPENLSKIERVKKFYETRVFDAPRVLFDVLEEQKQRLLKAKEKYGDYISPKALMGR